MEEKIDILMATYNGEKYINEQIDSILNQTYSNFRLVICDDNSTDNTYSILKEYEKKDNRVILLRNEMNLGYTKNFEKLLRNVQNNYFMFSDQDDVWNKDKVELSLNKLKNESADLVFTDLEIVDENLKTTGTSFNRIMGYINKILKCNNNYEMIYLYNVVTGCTIISKSKYLEKILPLPQNKDLIHDHFIPLVIKLNGGKIAYLDVPTIKYRQHNNNQVGTSRYTAKLKSFDDVREHLINVKISIFSEYVNRKRLFNNCNDIVKLNNIYLEYFRYLKSINIIGLKGINTYFKLYKFEKLSYKLLYLFIFHFPGICKIGYRFSRLFVKKKR